MASIEDFRLSALGQGVFAFCLPVRPGSVRDSIWRAEAMIHQLIDKKIIRAGCEALVVGRGPTGMAVAATLLKDAKARVTCCNMPPGDDEEPISACMSRTICPTTNDFPSDHWTLREFPPETSVQTRLPWHADVASEVYSRLSSSFRELSGPHIQNSSYVLLEPGVLRELYPGLDVTRVRVENTRSGTITEGDAQFVFICTGPGQHVTELDADPGRFAGFGFWSDQDEAMVAPKSLAGKRVLIVGGGDGGVGDFVRMLTGISDPFLCLEGLELEATAVDAIATINRQMWLGFNDGDESNDHDVMLSVQEALMKAIDTMWMADEKLQDRVNNLLLKDGERPFVQLAVRCYHFGLTYFGNRVVAQLLARALAARVPSSNGDLTPFRVGVESASLHGLNGHVCSSDRVACKKFPHRVTFQRSLCHGYQPVHCPPSIETRKRSSGTPAWRGTLVDDVGDVVFDRILPRAGLRPLVQHLPKSVADAVASKAKTLIRDVPPFYATMS